MTPQIPGWVRHAGYTLLFAWWAFLGYWPALGVWWLADKYGETWSIMQFRLLWIAFIACVAVIGFEAKMQREAEKEALRGPWGRPK